MGEKNPTIEYLENSCANLKAQARFFYGKGDYSAAMRYWSAWAVKFVALVHLKHPTTFVGTYIVGALAYLFTGDSDVA